MKTTSEVTARKMSAYWLTLLLLNGINVYPGHGKRGKPLTLRTDITKPGEAKSRYRGNVTFEL